MLRDFVNWILSLFATPKPAPMPTPPPTPPAPNPLPPAPEPRKFLLEDLMLAMRDFEGSPGNLNYKNNNPLNCRCSRVGYAKIYGAVKCVNNFAVFLTYQIGWLYAKNLIKQKIAKHPKWTIYQFISDPHEGWAPASDNNQPHNYAVFIGKRLGVDPYYFTMDTLS